MNGREYRYRVERFRDPESGKTKARWTYLGRAGGAQPRPRPRGDSTRERLIEALAALVEKLPWPEITVDLIAKEAGVAHGTPYRHFTGRWDILRAAIASRRAELERERPRFDGPVRSLDEERARVRGWVESVVSLPIDRPGLMRAYGALNDEFPADAAERRERQLGGEEALGAYLVALASAGLIAPPGDARQLAAALLLTIKGVYSGVTGSPARSKADVSRGVAELFDRAIFTPPR